MAKLSAGILVYRKTGGNVEVFLGHPGGPYWAKKDDHAWSVPKGEYEEDEDPLAAAKREFEEEIGRPAPEGEYLDLGDVKRKDGKVIRVWAVENDIGEFAPQSNTFSIEWPPKSGQTQEFPEIDRVAWFDLQTALAKAHAGQAEFIHRLAKELNVELDVSQQDTQATQQSLF